MPPEIVLDTARLFLRRFTAADAPLLAELDGDPEVMRHITGGAPTPQRAFEEVILPRWLRCYEASPPRGFWAAHERASGDFIGWFHLKPGPHDEADLGYRLRRSAWGRGYATEGARALVGRALTDWGAARVVAHALAANRASERVMQKCGLRFEAFFTIDESVLPGWPADRRRAVRYALARHEFIPDPRPPDPDSRP